MLPFMAWPLSFARSCFASRHEVKQEPLNHLEVKPGGFVMVTMRVLSFLELPLIS
jgi:hypothetical protein